MAVICFLRSPVTGNIKGDIIYQPFVQQILTDMMKGGNDVMVRLDMGDTNTAYTKLYGAPEGVFTSGSVINIFREGTAPEKNAVRGETKIYAIPYLKLKDGTLLLAQEGAAYSLLDVLQAMDSNWDDYSEDIQSVARNFYQTWAPYGMELWADQLSNIDS